MSTCATSATARGSCGCRRPELGRHGAVGSLQPHDQAGVAGALQAGLGVLGRAEVAARAEALTAERGSLQRLLEGYLGGLGAASKPSSHDARNILTNHVLKTFPELVARKAAQVAATKRQRAEKP